MTAVAGAGLAKGVEGLRNLPNKLEFFKYKSLCGADSMGRVSKSLWHHEIVYCSKWTWVRLLSIAFHLGAMSCFGMTCLMWIVASVFLHFKSNEKKSQEVWTYLDRGDVSEKVHNAELGRKCQLGLRVRIQSAEPLLLGCNIIPLLSLGGGGHLGGQFPPSTQGGRNKIFSASCLLGGSRPFLRSFPASAGWAV